MLLCLRLTEPWRLWIGLSLVLASCDAYVPVETISGLYETCCDGAGICVPNASVAPADAMRLAQDSCEEALVCVMKGLAEQTTTYLGTTCRSFAVYEGRCLPHCIPSVSARAKTLQQDGCADAWLCVPCFDPATGESTGACELSQDKPVEASRTFDTCCEERGRCVPVGAIDSDLRATLGPDVCASSIATLCVPEPWIDDPGTRPVACRAYGDSEGRCLPDCLPDVRRRSDELRVDSCQTGQKCVPCFDSVNGGETGACTFAGDEPGEPAQLFDTCCGDVGVCVPKEAVPVDDQARLDRDRCNSDEALCVPRDWIAYELRLPTQCNARGDVAGRCLPRCLPEVSKQAHLLTRDTCEETHLCVPCYDPLTGEDTHACSIGDDYPPADRELFGTCCDGGGRCVPRSIVDESAQGQLDHGSCADEEALCVPSPWLQDPPVKPAACHAFGDYEGRCLAACLPQVAERADRLRQDTCEASERCVPCFDPITGEPSGSCNINDDAPGPKRVFPNCCGEIGACVPPDALSPDEAERLKPATEHASTSACTDAALCTPKAWIQDADRPPDMCNTYGNAEGRCLPSCLPMVAELASQLLRETCGADYLCVPCYDPRTSLSTRACNIGADLPIQKPATFATCCHDIGWCVPQALVPESDRARLDNAGCDTSQAQVCAPADWAKSDRFVPTSCVAPGGLPARCLPDCLPAVASHRSTLTKVDCPDHHVCAPCFDPTTGENTHACEVGDDRATQPQLYPGCCEGSGLCVPNELISTSDRARLAPAGCDPAQAQCVPRAWTQEPRSIPTTCNAYDGAEGRCLSACLVDVAGKKDQLRQDSCAGSERCVPCFDPLDGHDTGACTQPGDAPKRPAVQFAKCCNDQGRCVPSATVASSERDQLAANSCSTPEHLCAPNDLLRSPRPAPVKCHGLLGAEGRCASSCLRAVASQPDRFVQDTCAANTTCVPCYGPDDGASTGICDQPGDAPTEPKRVFAACCGGAARCVPKSLVASADQSSLAHDSCKTPDQLCVPQPWLADPRQPPNTCRAPGDSEGRCLLDCLPDVSERTDSLRRTSCAENERCVPCYDPLNGETTGACGTQGDAPKEAKKVYADCCGTHGTCVPRELVNGSTDGLEQASCGSESLCVPERVARGQDPGFSACSATLFGIPLGNAGACVPSCFVPSDSRSQLSTSGCSDDVLCAPCDQVRIKNAACGG
ncbi:MAG: hypothetical protein RL701_8163 [Pseudomonadota bacterium]